MARAVIRVPRVDTQNGNNTNNGNTKQRSSLTSPKALSREQAQAADGVVGSVGVGAAGNVVAFDLPMDELHMHHVPSQQSNYPQQSGGINKVPSLMFDMEDTQEDELQRLTGTYEDTMPSQASLDRIRGLVEAQDEDQEMLAMHVNHALNDALERRGGEMDTEELGERLRTLGYTVTLRTALGGDSIGGTASCLRNLRHSFLAVSLPNANSPQSQDGKSNGRDADKVFIVDPKFLDQFEIAHSTSRYDAVLNVLPSAIVVPPGRLTDAVGVLCEEMARAFEKTGTPVPPWRQANAMLSKWQPRRSEDVTMTYRRTPGSGGKGREQRPQYNMPTIIEKQYGAGSTMSRANSGFGGEFVAGDKHQTAAAIAREGSASLDRVDRMDRSRRTSRQTTPDQADMEAFYSSDDMATDGKIIWPGYPAQDANNLVSEYVSLSI